MNSPKTIRLQNLAPDTNLSLNLFQLRPAAHGSMKKGPMLTPILIGRGGYYDVCAQLGVSYEMADAIVQQSPEVQAFKHGRRLAIIVWPPAEGEAVVAAPPPPAPEAETPAPGIVDEPTVVPEMPPLPVPAGGPPEVLPEADEATADLSASADEVTASERPARRTGEPNMDWAEDELRLYADTHQVDISKAKSKTSILRAIRQASKG